MGEKYYTVVNDIEIKQVSYIDLIAKCKNMLPNVQVVDQYSKKRKSKTADNSDNMEYDPVVSYIKSKITMQDILEEIGINTRIGRNCECPFHSSENGQCLSYDNHQFHCFHCNRSGSMFDFIMEYNSCSLLLQKIC